MATVLKIKNTAIGGRKPTTSQIETAELAVNLADAKLYTKTAGDQIIALGGSINSGATADRPNFPAVGDLFYDTDDTALYYWNGGDWIALSDGDDVDLGYTPAADKGTVTNTAGDDAELPVVDGTNAGLMAPAEYTKLIGLSDIKTDSSPPGSPNTNDIWIDTSECPPEIKVYTDCEDPGNPEWISIGGGGLDISFDLAMTGGDDVGDEKEAVVTNIFPAGLTPTYAWSVDGVVDVSATTSKRINKDSDVGFAVKCTVTISDKVKEVTSTNVVKWPDFTFALVFTPANVLLGNDITVATNPDPVVGGNGLDATFVSRQWTKDGLAIGGETAATYTTRAGDDSATIGCTLVYRNSDGTGSDVTVSADYPGTISTAFIAQPTILSPKDGAGEGGEVNYYPKTSAVVPDGVVVVEGAVNSFTVNTAGVTGAAYGNGIYVASASGYGGAKIQYSNNGEDWNDATGLENGGFDAVAYGAGQPFVAVAYAKPSSSSSTILYSTDGNTWQNGVQTSGGGTGGIIENNFGDIAYGGGTFVAVARDKTDRVKRSTDGINWDPITVPELDWECIAYNADDDDFMIIGNGSVYVSTDKGITWTNTSNALNSVVDVAYHNGKYVAVSSLTGISISEDNGVTWTNVFTTVTYSITYGGGKFVATGSSSEEVWTSLNGTDWTPFKLAETFAAGRKRVFYLNDKFYFFPNASSKDAYWSSNAEDSNTTLTLTNNKTFDSTDDSEQGTIQSDLTPGTKVTGENDTAFYGADTAAFSTTLYDGTGSEQAINTGIDNTIKSLIWIKLRNQVGGYDFQHSLYTSGVGFDISEKVTQRLTTSGNQGLAKLSNSVSSYDADGFKVISAMEVNDSTGEYVAWNFRAAPGFFDVVVYDGENSLDQVVPHSLGTEPGLIIVKTLSENSGWYVYHKELGRDKYLYLNNTDAEATMSDAWGTLDPTDTEFRIRSNSFGTGAGTENVAYLFADNPTGGIKCGSYTNKSQGDSVDLGFEPEWLLVKMADGTSNWTIYDNKRVRADLVRSKDIRANTAETEFDNAYIIFNDTGFTVNSTNSDIGDRASTYIYVAIAKDVVAGQFPPTGIVSEAKDDDNTLTLTDVTGTWEAGMRATGGTELTEYAPDPAALEFIGSIPSGSGINTWSYACWEVDTDPAFSSPLKAEPSITDPTALQKLTPGTLALANDTQYYARLKYEASDPAIESDFSDQPPQTVTSFKTAPTKDGWFAGETLESGEWASMTYCDGMYYSVKDSQGDGQPKIAYTADLAGSWTYVDFPAGIDCDYIAAGDINGTNYWVIAKRGNQDVYVTTDPTNSSSWTAVTLRTVIKTRLRYVGGTFVICCNEGVVMHVSGNNPASSSDWTISTPEGSGPRWQDVTYGDGKFVFCGYDNTSGNNIGKLLWTTDINGSSWNLVTGPSGVTYFEVAYSEQGGSHVFAAVTNNGSSDQQVICTNDIENIAWYNKEVSSSISSFITISAQNGVFVVGHTSGGTTPLYNSDDLFASTSPFSPITLTSLASGVLTFSAILNDYFVFLTNGGTYAYSATGKGTQQNLFFDAANGVAVTEQDIVDRFGVDPTTNLNRFGVYDLTEQPTYPVQAYVQARNKYVPIKDFSVELASAEEEAAQANARLDAANAQLTALKADFEARLAALEAADD